MIVDGAESEDHFAIQESLQEVAEVAVHSFGEGAVGQSAADFLFGTEAGKEAIQHPSA